MKYIVSISRFENGHGYAYESKYDTGESENLFTAAEWNNCLDEPFTPDEDGGWKIRITFYADGADPLFDEPVNVSDCDLR